MRSPYNRTYPICVEIAPFGIQHNDRLRNGIGDSAKFLFLLAEFSLRPFQVINIGVCAIPFDDISELVAKWCDAEQEPAIFSIIAPQSRFDLPESPEANIFRHASISCCKSSGYKS